MLENKIETIKGLCVVNITKFIMTKLGLSADDCEKEIDYGAEELYKFLEVA